MSRRAAIVFLLSVAGIALLLLLTWRLRGGEETTPAPSAASETTGPAGAAPAPAGESRDYALYFPSEGGSLRAEPRALPVATADAAGVEALVAALLAGPTRPGLHPLFPVEVGVGSVHVSPGGIVYLDLRGGGPQPPAAGSRWEMLTVYGLVDTVLLNFPDLRAVTLLWNGQQLPSFSGHIDTGRPLAVRTELVDGGS